MLGVAEKLHTHKFARGHWIAQRPRHPEETVKLSTRNTTLVASGALAPFGFALAQSVGLALARSPQAAETAPVSVAAAESGAPTLTVLEPIRVEASVPSEVRDTPGAADRLTEAQIDTYRAYTLHDLLDFVPGLRHIDDDTLGRRSGIGIRGAPSRRSRKTLLLEDGVPINASTYLDPGAHYTPPTERLQSVDILKGAGHVLHGPLNNHGIVNFINKKPTRTAETTLEVGAGDLGAFKRHAMHTRTDGSVGTVLAYTGLDADGAFDVEETGFNDFFASLDWNLASGHHLGVSATYLRERSNYDESNLTPVEFALDPRRKRDRFGQEFNTIAVDYQKYALVHDFQLSERLSVSTVAFVTDLDRPRFTVDPDEVEADALPEFVYADPAREFVPGVSGVMISRDRHYQTYGIETRMQLTESAGQNLTHTWQWGLRFERHFLDNRESFGDIGEVLRESNRGSFSGENEFEEAAQEKFQASAASLFVQDSLRFGNLTLIPGLRVEHYTQNKTLVSEGDAVLNEREEDDNTLVLPSISLLYERDDNTQLFGNIARGYAPAFARTAAEFPLEPETAINSQIGLRSRLSPLVSIEGAVFYNLIQDTVVQEPFTINDENLVVNAEDSVSYGIDFGLRVASRALEDTGLRVFGELAYNYTRAEFSGGELDGNHVPEVPENAGSLTLGLEHSSGFHLSATASHFGSFFSDLANTRERVLADEDGVPIGVGENVEIREPAVLGEVASHTIFSARASYAFGSTPRTELWLQGRNLSDRLYVTDHENGIRPGAERSVIAGVTLRFR